MPTFNAARWAPQTADIKYETTGISGPMPVARRQPEDPDKVQLRDERRVMGNIVRENPDDVDNNAQAMLKGGVRPELVKDYEIGTYQSRATRAEALSKMASTNAELMSMAVDTAERGDYRAATQLANMGRLPGDPMITKVEPIGNKGSGQYKISGIGPDGKESSYNTTAIDTLRAATSRNVLAQINAQHEMQRYKQSQDNKAVLVSHLEGEAANNLMLGAKLYNESGGKQKMSMTQEQFNMAVEAIHRKDITTEFQSALQGGAALQILTSTAGKIGKDATLSDAPHALYQQTINKYRAMYKDQINIVTPNNAAPTPDVSRRKDGVSTTVETRTKTNPVASPSESKTLKVIDTATGKTGSIPDSAAARKAIQSGKYKLVTE